MIGAGWKPLADLGVQACNLYGLKILQIKEKFGALRIYTSGNFEDPTYKSLTHILDELEWLSTRTCENCGNPGEKVKVNNGYWIKTLCPSCPEVDFSKAVSYNY